MRFGLPTAALLGGKGRLLGMLLCSIKNGRGIIRFDKGQKIWVGLDDHIEAGIYRYGAYEPEITAASWGLTRGFQCTGLQANPARHSR